MRQVPSSRSALERVVGRRTTLALGLGAGAVLGLGLSGCDLDDLTGRSTGPTSSDEPADDPDQALVDSVLADLDQQLLAVAAARAATPSLRRALRPLEEMHRAHRAVLEPGPTTAPSTSGSPAAPAPSTAPRPPARTLRRVTAAETAHQEALTTAAVAARSGALARVLASMSASVAQHLAVLPAAVSAP